MPPVNGSREVGEAQSKRSRPRSPADDAPMVLAIWGAGVSVLSTTHPSYDIGPYFVIALTPSKSITRVHNSGDTGYKTQCCTEGNTAADYGGPSSLPCAPHLRGVT